MINWVMGGLIIGLTVVIIFKNINKLRKGESTCGCHQGKEGCSCGSCDLK